MTSDAEALVILGNAWSSVLPGTPTDAQLVIAACVSRLEGYYGNGWKGTMVGSNNWGAIQAGMPPCQDGVSRLYTDSYPNADGTSTSYSVCFKEYATPEDGAADVLKVLYKNRPTVLAAAATGNVQAVAEAMYDTTYYQGFGATKAIRVKGYADAIWTGATAIEKNTGVPTPLVRGSATDLTPAGSIAGAVGLTDIITGKWIAFGLTAAITLLAAWELVDWDRRAAA